VSTVTRRKKAALAAGKAPKMDALPIPEFSEATNGNGNGGETPRLRVAKPILSNLEPASNYALTDHASEQMAARGISPAEVLSAIIDPDSTLPSSNGNHNLCHDRGDIRVVVDPKTFSVVTVIDLDEDSRMAKRTPQWANLVLPQKIPAVLPVQKAPVRRVPKDLPESEEVRWLFAKHTKEDIRYVDVSPVIAKALLDRNTRNRKIRTGDIKEWSQEMEGGRWRITHQGIAIARDGVILDGQHRLESVVESGVTVRMPVAVGLDPEVFSVIDTGRKRNSADAMSMVGEASAFQYAAITRLAMQYETGALNRSKGGHANKFHSDVLLAYREGKEDAIRMATKVGGNARIMGLPINKTAVGTAFLLIHQACNDDDLIHEFFEGIRTGINLSGNDARYILRRVVTNDPRPLSKKQLALILKAWKLYAMGEPIKPRTILTFREDEEMPPVFVPLPRH